MVAAKAGMITHIGRDAAASVTPTKVAYTSIKRARVGASSRIAMVLPILVQRVCGGREGLLRATALGAAVQV